MIWPPKPNIKRRGNCATRPSRPPRPPRAKRIEIEKPTDLRDLVWTPAQFVWTNGGQVSGHIPTRYTKTEGSTDGQLRLARKTEWAEHDGGYAVGLGQRLLATDAGEHALLECKTIELTHPAPDAA